MLERTRVQELAAKGAAGTASPALPCGPLPEGAGVASG